MNEASSNKSEALHNGERGGRNLSSCCLRRLELPGEYVLCPTRSVNPQTAAKTLAYTSVLLGKLTLSQ